MANILVSIGKDIEVAAGDLLKWVTTGATTAEKLGPGALAGLGVLAGAVEKALVDAATAASNPATLVLNLGSDIEDIKAVWPDLKAFLQTLGVKI